MDFFKFIPGEDPSFLTNGAYINGIKTAQWVERYRPAGMFKFTAPVSSGLRDFLPLGTMISHIGTKEVMVVDTHEIDESNSKEISQVTISGLGLDAWLVNRIVGGDVYESGFDSSIPIPDYILDFDTTWNQIAALINLQIKLGPPTLDDPGGRPLINVGDVVEGFIAIPNEQHTVDGIATYRIVERGVLYDRVLEMLKIDDFGIKIVRPNPDNVDPATTEFRIHNGVDRTADVIFSHARGDLENSHYLWSNRDLRNDGVVITSYLDYRYHPSDWLDHQGYNRRVGLTEASDLDSQVSLSPDGYDFTPVFDAGRVRAADDLKASSQLSLMSTDISKTTPYVFRKHYDVGDIVTVNGNYDVETFMRVTEFVEFEDENGESGYPTLSALNE